jgi:hypothetical protein
MRATGAGENLRQALECNAVGLNASGEILSRFGTLDEQNAHFFSRSIGGSATELSATDGPRTGLWSMMNDRCAPIEQIANYFYF